MEGLSRLFLRNRKSVVKVEQLLHFIDRILPSGCFLLFEILNRLELKHFEVEGALYLLIVSEDNLLTMRIAPLEQATSSSVGYVSSLCFCSLLADETD